MIYTAIDTFYVSEEQLQNSPSRKDGIDESTEALLRRYGCELIQESGILLKLPQAVMATGQVLFHRFYCKKSFVRFNVKRVAASCVWLAGKLEESPRKVQHVLNVFHRMECRRETKPLQLLDPFSKKYEDLKIELIRTERHLLKEMGFICHVEHPHKFVINYLTQLQAPLELMQEAWSIANDSLRTTLCVRFRSEVVACGVVYACARRFGLPLPENPPWWKVFDAEKSEIDEVCKVLAYLYRQPKACCMEVSKATKSFVLTTRAWDPPPDSQVNSNKPTSINRSVQGCTRLPNSDARDSMIKIALDKLKSSKLVEARVLDKNRELRGKSPGDIEGHSKDREDDAVEKGSGKGRSRLKDCEHVKEREREHRREHDRTRGHKKSRDRDKNAEKDQVKVKNDYVNKDRIKDSGYLEKTRHHSSSRDKSYSTSYTAAREKESHRHHPYA